MKKLKLIYNPHSGGKQFKYELDACILEFQRGGYETHVFRSLEYGDIASHLEECKNETYDAIVVSGGDGTVNLVVNAMLKNNITAPLGILPNGTANDFAAYLKIPSESDKAAAVIAAGKTMKTDVGLVNDTYFINVCAFGALANISQKVDPSIKQTIGKFAYYIKGIEQVPSLTPIPLKITTSRDVYELDLYLILVLNSAGTGGFVNLSPGAQIDDGLFDFIGIKAAPIKDIALLFIKIVKGEHMDDPNILFFRDNRIQIEATKPIEADSETDIDGETGPPIPFEIQNIQHALTIFIP